MGNPFAEDVVALPTAEVTPEGQVAGPGGGDQRRDDRRIAVLDKMRLDLVD